MLLIGGAVMAYYLARRPAPFDDGWSDITDGDWWG